MTYLEQLFASTLPLPVWAIGLCWAVVAAASFALAAKAGALSGALPYVEHTAAPLKVPPKLIVLAIAEALGDGFATFIAGGWLLNAVVWLVVGLHRVLSLRLYAGGTAISGRIRMLPGTSHRETAYTCFSMAALAIAICLLVPHLALLGVAYFLIPTGIGHLRRARRAAPA